MRQLSKAEIFGISLFAILTIIWLSTVAYSTYNYSKRKSSEANSKAQEIMTCIAIHVAGAVSNPGVYELPPESRVSDALELAGGLTGDADTGILNLAEILLDGQKIYVPMAGEEITSPLITDDASIIDKVGGKQSVKFPLNLNTASCDDLQCLPGIGEVRAQDIVDYRIRHGGFKKKSELMNVKGIGDVTYEKISQFVYV